MPRILLIILSALLGAWLLASCSPKDAHGISTDPLAATGFITKNPPTPETASDSRGDGILRDLDGRPYGYALLGRRLPAFNGNLVGGGRFDSMKIERWTVIDVWGIWCGDCMADAPYVNALHTAIKQDPDLDFISVHVPATANRLSPEEMFGKYGSVEAYFKSKGYSYPTLIDTDMTLRATLQISWTPSYLLVSPDGIVRGYRTDLSVVKGEPVKDFIRDIARVRGEVRKAAIEGIKIGSDGVGGIKGPTAFTLEAIQNAFPGQRIVAMHGGAKDERMPVFLVYDVRNDTSPLFTIAPTWDQAMCRNIMTESPQVTGPSGERIGESRLGDLSPERLGHCTMSQNGDFEPIITCNDPELSPAFFLTYTPVSSDPELDVENHLDAKLASMTYLPPLANR